MERHNETVETWNNIASLYESKFMDMDVYNHTYDWFSAQVQQDGAQLLEVGCGPGNITRYLLSKRPDFQVLGIDIAPNMIILARQHNPSARFEVMDCRNIKQLNQPFDGVVAGFCLPYLSSEEAAAFVSDTATLLRSNGVVYISFVEGDPKDSEYKSGSGGRVFFHYHRLDWLLRLLRLNGFDEGKVFRVPYPVQQDRVDEHTIIVAKKQ